MKSDRTTGRVIGILLLAHLVGMTAAFAPMMQGIGADFLTKAAAMEAMLRFTVMLLFVNGGIALAMSIIAFPVIREHSVKAGIAVVAVGAAWLVMQSVDNAHIMSMLSMSKRYAESAGANADLYSLVAASLRSTRGFVHYGVLLTIDAWFGLFYGSLFMFRLVPRWLGVIGLVAVALHTIGISLSAFIGYGIMWPLAYGFAVAYLAFGGWLVARGFPEAELKPDQS